MQREPEYSGRSFTIEAMRLPDGSYPAGEFLDELPASDRRKLDVLFEMLGEHGQIRNREKFKKLEGSDGIFAFKSHQIRIPCFFAPDRRVILCFGLIKKQDKYSREDIRRAEELRRTFLG